MSRQQLELGRLTIKKDERESNAIPLHNDTVVLTIYSSDQITGGEAFVEVSSDDSRYVQLYHRGVVVKVQSNGAFSVPIPACKSLRLSTLLDQEEDRVFQVLELLEM